MYHPPARRGRVARSALFGTAATTVAAFALVLPAPSAQAHHDATGQASAQAVEANGILAILDTSPECEAIDTKQTRYATPVGRCGAGLNLNEQVKTFTQDASAGNGSSAANAGTAPIAIEDFTSVDLNGVLQGLDDIDSGTVLDPVVQALDPITQGLVKTALKPLITPLNAALQATLGGVEQALPLSVEVGAVTAQCTATGSPFAAAGSTTVSGIDIIIELGPTKIQAPIQLGTGANAPLTVTAPQDLVDGVLDGVEATLRQTLGGLLAPLNAIVDGLQDTVIDTLLTALEPSLLSALTDALRAVVSGRTNLQNPVSPSTTGQIAVTALELNLLSSNTARLANASCGPNEPGTTDETDISYPTVGDLITDNTPTITGTGEPGSTVTITIDDRTPVDVPVDANGDWSYTPTVPLNDGQHDVAVDGNANGPGEDDRESFDVDATRSSAPVILTPADGSSTNDTTPTITGTGEAGATIEVSIDDTVIGTTTANANGNWSLDTTTQLAEGTYLVSATQTDQAGNTSPSNTSAFTVDTTKPDAPKISNPFPGSKISDTTPIITGTGEPGASIEVSIDDTVIGTTTADSNGNWSLETTTPLAEGTHKVTATQTDEAGNTSDAAEVTFTVDSSAPDATIITSPREGEPVDNSRPTISGTGEPGSNVTITIDGGTPVTVPVDGDGNWTYTPATPLDEGKHDISVDGSANGPGEDDTVSFHVDATAPGAPVISNPVDGSTINDDTPTITGTGEPGATIEVSIDNTVIGTTIADTNGDWSITPGTALTEDEHIVSATQTDEAGNISPSNTATFTVDTTEPAAPLIDNPDPGAIITDSTPTITGTGEPGATVEVSIDGTVIGTTVVGTDGTWSLDTTTALSNAPHTVTATQTDEAGNKSDEAKVDFSVDTTGPADTVIDSPTAGQEVDDNTPTISGTGEPGSNVTITIDDQDPVTVVVDGDGNWTYTPTTPLDDSEHEIKVDGDANGTGVDDTITFVVDAVPTDNTPGDTDTDGIKDSDEKILGTDPTKPDTDGDGLSDGQEINGPTGCTTGDTDPLKPDTDGDKLSDGQEVNGVDVQQVYYKNRGVPRKARTIGIVRTNPCVVDTDGDGLSDGQEVNGSKIKQKIKRSKANGGTYKIKVRKTDPTRADTDGDKLSDGDEVTGKKNKKFKHRKTDPTLADTDWGGGRDGKEIKTKHDPSRHG